MTKVKKIRTILEEVDCDVQDMPLLSYTRLFRGIHIDGKFVFAGSYVVSDHMGRLKAMHPDVFHNTYKWHDFNRVIARHHNGDVFHAVQKSKNAIDDPEIVKLGWGRVAHVFPGDWIIYNAMGAPFDHMKPDEMWMVYEEVLGRTYLR